MSIPTQPDLFERQNEDGIFFTVLVLLLWSKRSFQNTGIPNKWLQHLCRLDHTVDLAATSGSVECAKPVTLKFVEEFSMKYVNFLFAMS